MKIQAIAEIKEATDQRLYSLLAYHSKEIRALLQAYTKREVSEQLGLNYTIFTTWLKSTQPYDNIPLSTIVLESIGKFTTIEEDITYIKDKAILETIEEDIRESKLSKETTHELY